MSLFQERKGYRTEYERLHSEVTFTRAGAAGDEGGSEPPRATDSQFPLRTSGGTEDLSIACDRYTRCWSSIQSVP